MDATGKPNRIVIVWNHAWHRYKRTAFRWKNAMREPQPYRMCVGYNCIWYRNNTIKIVQPYKRKENKLYICIGFTVKTYCRIQYNFITQYNLNIYTYI